jgi:hypothetical protein
LGLALAACADPAPADPTWAEVAPVLAAHCVRCHGAPALGGAPPTFRLDRYDDTVLPATDVGADTVGLRRVLGAAAMAEWIALRAEDGSMPPRIPLAEHDRELLSNWFAGRQPLDDAPGSLVLPRRGPPHPGNAPPTFSLKAEPADGPELAGYQLTYELRDADRDLAFGELTATLVSGDRSGPTIPIGELRAGRGALIFDTALLPGGDYALAATLDDGSGPVRSLAAELSIAPPRPAPPRLALVAPAQGDYVAAAELPLTIELTARDADTAQLAVTAVLLDDRAGATVIATTTTTVVAGAATRVSLGADDLPAGLSYRVRVTASDGTSTATAQSGRFRVSRETSSDTFQTISDDVLALYCVRCHAAFPRVPTLAIDLTRYRGTPERPGVFELRRRIFQRAVLAQSMPPGSQRLEGGELPAEARDRLARWLLAGAPQ